MGHFQKEILFSDIIQKLFIRTFIKKICKPDLPTVVKYFWLKSN